MSETRNLYFQRSNGTHIFLAKDITEEEVHKEIKKFLNARNFKSYYTRTWETDGVKYYDVGSWSEFFKWTNKELK